MSGSRHRVELFAASAIALTVSGCGLKTPQMTLSSDPHATSDQVIAILGEVSRELGCAVMDVRYTDIRSATLNGTKRRLAWLDSATAILTLTLTVEDSSALNPGVTVTAPLANSVKKFGSGTVTTGQSSGVGVGASLSADATRQDVSDYTISMKDAYIKHADSYTHVGALCTAPHDGVLLQSDLHLYDWLDSRLRPYIVEDSLKDVAPKTLTTTITFVVKASGNVNPMWKLVPTSFSTASSPLFALNRNNTDILLVTIGATAADATTAHNIAKTGAAVGLGNAAVQ